MFPGRPGCWVLAVGVQAAGLQTELGLTLGRAEGSRTCSWGPGWGALNTVRSSKFGVRVTRDHPCRAFPAQGGGGRGLRAGGKLLGDMGLGLRLLLGARWTVASCPQLRLTRVRPKVGQRA